MRNGQSSHNAYGRWIDKDAGIERAGGIHGRLCRLQGRRERLRSLAVIPAAVRTAHRVMVRDRAAAGDHRVRCGALDLRPLLELLAAADRREDRVIGGWTIRINVREA